MDLGGKYQILFMAAVLGLLLSVSMPIRAQQGTQQGSDDEKGQNGEVNRQNSAEQRGSGAEEGQKEGGLIPSRFNKRTLAVYP